MASIKDLKKRIGTVKNTQQTTRAMKMVSAAKLRRAQDAIGSHRPYARSIAELIQRLASTLEESQSTGMPRAEGVEEPVEGARRVLLVLVTSDRGLCGAFNGNIIKGAQRWLKAHQGAYGKVELGFVGRRGFDFFKTRKFNLGTNYSEATGKVTFAKAKILANSLTELYVSGHVDEVKIIYNEFKNAVSQNVVVEDFLPLQPKSAADSAPTDEKPAADGIYIIKPSAEELLKQLVAKNFAIQAFRILLESQASEHGARMSAMENATKNAGEMIRKLTLQYNKQRQAGITKELLEIISGSESQKNTA